jgi:TonB family protein
MCLAATRISQRRPIPVAILIAGAWGMFGYLPMSPALAQPAAAGPGTPQAREEPAAQTGSGSGRTNARIGKGFPEADAFFSAAGLAQESGIVNVRACVRADGTLSADPTVEHSSGSPRLDEVALAFARAGSGHYVPATKNGKPVESCFVFRVVSNQDPPYDPVVAAQHAIPDSADIRACVGVDGKLTEDPTVARSSGNPRLDDGALRLAKAGSGRYTPLTANGKPVAGCFVFRVVFELQKHLGDGFPAARDFYPQASRLAGESGSPTVHVCVWPSGNVSGVPTVKLTSGNPRLDEAALALARAGSGHYKPDTEDGKPVSSCFVFSVSFTPNSQEVSEP